MVTFHDDDDDKDADSDYKAPRRLKTVGAKRKREVRRGGGGGGGGGPVVAAPTPKSPPPSSNNAFVIPYTARRSYMEVRLNTVNICESIQNGDLDTFNAALQRSRYARIDFAAVTTPQSSPLLDCLLADFHGMLTVRPATKFHETHRLEMIRAILGHPTTRAPFSEGAPGAKVLMYAVLSHSEAVFTTLISDQRLKPEHWEANFAGDTVFNALVATSIQPGPDETAASMAQRGRQWDARVASIVPLVSERALNLSDGYSPLANAVRSHMVQTLQAMSMRYEELDVHGVLQTVGEIHGIGADQTIRSYNALVEQKTAYYRTLLPCVAHATQLLDVLVVLVVQFLVPAQKDTAADLSRVFSTRK